MENQILNALKNNKLFEHTDIEKFSLENVKGKLISLTEGQILFRVGEEIKEIYLLVSGEINEVKRNPEGRPISLIYEDASYFGVPENNDSKKRNSTAVALKDSYLISLSQKEIYNIASQDNEIARLLKVEIPLEIKNLNAMNVKNSDQNILDKSNDFDEVPTFEDLDPSSDDEYTRDYIADSYDLNASSIEETESSSDEVQTNSIEEQAESPTVSENVDEVVPDDELNFLNLSSIDTKPQPTDQTQTTEEESQGNESPVFLSPESKKILTEEIKKLADDDEDHENGNLENIPANELKESSLEKGDLENLEKDSSFTSIFDEQNENISDNDKNETIEQFSSPVENDIEALNFLSDDNKSENEQVFDENVENPLIAQTDEHDEFDNRLNNSGDELIADEFIESGFKSEEDLTDDDLLRALGELPPSNDLQNADSTLVEPKNYTDDNIINTNEENFQFSSKDDNDNLIDDNNSSDNTEETLSNIIDENGNNELLKADNDLRSSFSERFSVGEDKTETNFDTSSAELKNQDDDNKIIESESKNDVTSTHRKLRTTVLDLDENEDENLFTKEHLHKIIKAVELVNSNVKIDEVLKSITYAATELTYADRGTLYLVDNERNELWSKVAIGNESKEIRLKIGEGIAGWVAKEAEILNISDVLVDPRFNKNIDRSSGYKTKSMLCFPIKNREMQIIGVIQLLNSNRGEFNSVDENLLHMISVHAALAIENAELVEKLLQTERVTSLGKMANFLIQDIKKPMLVTKRYTEHLKQKELPQEIAQLVDMILEQINSVTDIVQTTSSYSEGKAILRTRDVSVNDTLSDYFARIDSYVRSRNCILVNEFDTDTTIKIDVKEMFQCYKHIIKNACDAMPEGGNINLKTIRDKDKVQIIIKDAGLGIPETLRGKIFDPFMSHGKKEGTGLGLSITKKLIEEMNGTITFESVLGEGTSFIITLPISNF